MGHKILIIDDDDDIIDSVQTLLSYEGFDVISANRVDSGLEKIENENPELVLLDIIYPEGQDVGFKAALDIKKLRPELHVFAFSALNRDYSFDFKKEDARVDEFVVKPINLKKLVDMINKYLE